MLRDFLATIVAPLVVGIALKLFDYWLNNQHNDH